MGRVDPTRRRWRVLRGFVANDLMNWFVPRKKQLVRVLDVLEPR